MKPSKQWALNAIMAEFAKENATSPETAEIWGEASKLAWEVANRSVEVERLEFIARTLDSMGISSVDIWQKACEEEEIIFELVKKAMKMIEPLEVAAESENQ